MKQLEKYLWEVGVGIMELRSMSKQKIKLIVHVYEEGMWREELNRRETS